MAAAYGWADGEEPWDALAEGYEPGMRARDIEVHVELGIDGERERLRDAAQAAGEHDRGAELAEPARERERETGDQAAAGERQHDTEEGAHGAGAERARGGGEIGIRGFEGGDRLTDVERAGDVGDGDRHCALREWERDSERTQAGAEQSEASEGRKQADAGDGGRQHERKLDERDREGVARKAAVREQELGATPENAVAGEDEDVRIQVDEVRGEYLVETERHPVHEREEGDDETQAVGPFLLVGDAVTCRRPADQGHETIEEDELAEQQGEDRLGVEQEDRDLQRLGLRGIDPSARLHG